MEKRSVKVEVHQVSRVEGDGNIYVNVKDRTIGRCEWNISEAPRFFESMGVGPGWNELDLTHS